MNLTADVDVLDSIRKTEERAEKMFEDAKKKKEQTIEDAKKAALKMVADFDNEIDKKMNLELANFKKAVESQKRGLLEENKKYSLEIKKQSEKNIGKAASFLVDKFESVV